MSFLDPYDPRNYKKTKEWKSGDRRNYGSVSNSTVKWVYNFDPLKRLAVILFGSIIMAGMMWTMKNEYMKYQEKISIKQHEAKEERKKYLMEQLEQLKQKTIAEAKGKTKK